jgi:hypothetical protein
MDAFIAHVPTVQCPTRLMSASPVQEYTDSASAAGNEYLAAAAAQVRLALLRMPCDVVQEPTSMHDAARRLAALIPPVTPFRVLEDARRDLAAAMEQCAATRSAGAVAVA